MSILIVCDVCGRPVGSDGVSIKTIICEEALLAIGYTPELEDICTACVSVLNRNTLDCLRSLSTDIEIPPPVVKKPSVVPKKQKSSQPNGNRGKKKAVGITRVSRGHADHSKSYEMRLALCRLVDEGKYDRKTICHLLYKEFPHYSSPHSFDPRVSDLIQSDKAYRITQFLKNYKGREATVDRDTSAIIWRN